MNSNIVFVLNKSEITAGTRGASLGPDAILTAARKRQSAILDDSEIVEISNYNRLLDTPTAFQFAKRIDGLTQLYEELCTKVSQILQHKKFPLILAADHGSAGGTIAGIKNNFPDKRLGVVWIDAHADIHTPYTTPSGNLHGMPLATALNFDNLECKINEVEEQTVLFWNTLKNIGGTAPKINAEDLVYIGVRDTEEQENEAMKRLAIKNYAVEEVRAKGIASVLDEIETKLSHCDCIYVSFDVDAMDPDLTSHGTGTPVDNGLTPEEANTILTRFAANPKTVCMEIVEVNPCLDEKINTMAEVTLDLIEAIVENKK